MTGRKKGRLLAVTGLLVTAVILIFFLIRLDWREFVDAFRTLRPSWLLASVAAIIGSVALRSVRWRRLSITNGDLRPFWDATVIGYVGNVVYPARAGEALRIVAICRSTALTPGQAIASAFADRLADVFVLGAVALAVLVLAGLGPQDNRVVAAVVLLSALPIAVFVGFARWGERWSDYVATFGRCLPRPLGRTLPEWFAHAVDHTSMLRRPATVASVLSLSVGATAMDYFSIWLAMQAMGWSLPFVSAVLLGVLLAMGTLIPAAPGYVGVYQVASVLALTRYGASEAAALAFSVVIQVLALASIVLQAVFVFAHYGWRMKDLQLARQASEWVETAEERDR